ncbi:hypothetical protein [Adhaeretor mobilis]|uniref:Uncharacterized protein n=1 Tax=Adhaeretor mobilis TaxID=1930276 RepID=A0A517MXL7_9BACT|nr:hypothetical protein [Adhaeretor mobilis]QDS99624.1 hypothetical protein HG15A2_29500 [Adhaeretor mobilis]
MHRKSCKLCEFLRRLTLLAFLITPLHAEDDGWLEFEDQAAAVQNQFEVSPEQFEQWVFQHQGSADAALKKLERQLTLTVEEMSRACELNKSQEMKLRLAGQYDIRQFFNEYAKVRNKFMEVRHDQNEFNKIWNDIQPLQQKLGAGLFNADSIYKKVADGTLNKQQGLERRKAERERRQFRYQALIELHILQLEKAIPLHAKQRERLVQLILAETQPPSIFGQNDQIYLSYHLSQVAKKKITKAVDGAQGRALVKMYQKGRGYKHHLESQGVVPFEEEDEVPAVKQATREAQIDRAVEEFVGRNANGEIQGEVIDAPVDAPVRIDR